MKREKPRHHLTAVQFPGPKGKAGRIRLFLALLSLVLVALWQSATYGQADQSEPVSGPAGQVSVGLLGFSDETGMNPRSGVRKTLEGSLRQALFDRGLDPKWVDSASPGSPAALTAEQLAKIGRSRGVKFVVRSSLAAITFNSRPGEVRISIRVEAEVVSVETAVARSVTAESSAVGRLKDQEPLPTLDSVDFGNRDFASSSSGQALRRALSNSGNRLAELIHDVVTAPVEGYAENADAEEAEMVEEQPQDDPIAQEEAPAEDAEIMEPEDEADLAEEETTADNEEDLQQLIAQAEEAVSGSRNVDPADVERLRQSLEQLLQSLEDKSRLLEAGDLASTGQVDQAIEAERADLQEAVEGTYTEEDFDDIPVSEASPTTHSLFERVNEYVGLTFNVIQKIQELRSTFHQAQEDYSAMEPDWAPNNQYSEEQVEGANEPVEESLAEVSGVVTEGGEPVEGAVITEPLSEQTVTTDETGSYALEDIPPRNTQLLVSKAGRSLAEGVLNLSPGRKAIADFTLGSKRISGASNLLASARVLPSAVTVARKAGARSVGNVRGVVQDSRGRPIPRALVQLKGLSVARTDSRGRYAFSKVPTGSHLLTVLKTGLTPRTETVQIQPRRTLAANLKVVEASRVFQPNSPFFDRKADPNRTAALYGQVTERGNRPVVGAKVSLSVARKSKAVSVRTRADGRYQLRGLHPDAYRVVVTRVGFKDFIRSSVSLDAGKSVTGNFRLAEAPSDSRTKAIERVVRGLGEVRGFVRDSNRKGIAGAAVALKRAGGSVVSRVTTDVRGRYVLKAIAGSYRLNVKKQGLRDGSSAVVLRARDSITKDFELAPRSAGLPGRGAHSGGTGQLRGRVREEASGKAIRNALVSVHGRTTRTDNAGGFRVSSLAAGNYRVTVAKEGYRDREAQVSIRRGGTTQREFLLAAVRSRQVPSRQIGGRQTRSARLTGRVTDERRGSPLVGVRVMVGGRSDTTDRQGSYAIPDLAPGSYRVTVSKAGHLSETKNVTIHAGQTVTANFRLAARTISKTK